MPAAPENPENPPFVIGVDGCRAGWVAVKHFCGGGAAEVSIWPDFQALLAHHGAPAAMIMVDMPIGFPDRGRRACEKMARTLLKPKRSASVFPTPARPMLAFETYEEANAWGKAQGPGGGLPKQTWMLMPKIRELDRLISPPMQDKLGEAHPEVAFWRLNQETPCAHSKKTGEGRRERVGLLAKNGLANAQALYETAREKVGAGVGADDVYDACALSLTAEARLQGSAHQLTDGARDATGLLMEIWG